MKEFINTIAEKFLRESRKLLDIIPLAIILSFVVIMGGSLIGSIIMKIPAVERFLSQFIYSASMYEFLSNYTIFIGIWIAVLFTISVFPGNHPMFRALGYNRKGNNIRGFLVGTLLGFCSNSLAVVISLLC